MPPSLTLKQRLAALTASQSSSSSGSASTSSGNVPVRPSVSINLNPPARNSSLKKGIFGSSNSNWSSSRETLGAEGVDPYAMERVQEVMGSVIYQAGVDYE